jgi:hypothetical protein
MRRIRARRAAVEWSGKPPDAAMALISSVIPGHRSSNHANRSACSRCPFPAGSPVGVPRSVCWSTRGCRPAARARERPAGRGRVTVTRCGAGSGVERGAGRAWACSSLRSSGSAGRVRSAVTDVGRVGVVGLLPCPGPARVGRVLARGDWLQGVVRSVGPSVRVSGLHVVLTCAGARVRARDADGRTITLRVPRESSRAGSDRSDRSGWLGGGRLASAHADRPGWRGRGRLVRAAGHRPRCGACRSPSLGP